MNCTFSRFFYIASILLACAALPAHAQDGHEGHNHASPTQSASPSPTPSDEAAKDNADLLQPLKTDHIIGHPDAPVLMIEYASLSCSHCANFHNDTYPALKEKYIDTGKVLFIFRHYPLNEPALRGAMLTECVDDKFFSFLKVLFKSQTKWAYSADHQDALRTLASVGGMSQGSFNACMADEQLKNRIIAHLKWAADELQVSSTPSFFINGEMVQGSRNIEALSKIIDAELAKTRAE